MANALHTGEELEADGWFEEANAAEEALGKLPRLAKWEVRDTLSLAGLWRWVLLPGSEPGDCRRFVMVLVDEGLGHNASDDLIRTELERRMEQSLIYVTRICPQAEGILFVLARSHFSWSGGWRSAAHLHWREIWCRYRALLARERPDLRFRVAFLNRIREGRRACHFDRDGAPVGGRLLLNWWQGASAPARDLLRDRICFLRHLGIEPDLDCRYYEPIGSDQPQGCNFVPVLDFGASLRPDLAEPGLAARLYLTEELALPVAFPESRYNRAQGMEILTGPNFAAIGEPLWRPADMSLFVRDPGLWLTRTPGGR